MATHPDYPHASSFEDRHGTTRWRFRRAKKTTALPGQPGDPAFEEHYNAVVEGRAPKKASVIGMPGAMLTGCFRDAWRKAQRTPEWLAHDPATKLKNTRLAEEFLELTIVEGGESKWGDMLVRDLKRRHAKDILARFSATPHKAKHMIVAVRKMLLVALDEEWIESDPTYKLAIRPEYKGWRAWTEAERATFEARWPIGSTPRTVYGLALWLGNRRSDISDIPWSVFDFSRNTVTIQQTKGDKTLILPLSPMLREILEPLDRTREFVVVTAYKKPFSAKSLTGMMAHWTNMADMGKGCTLHGLRKTLGKLLAESGSTTRQLMEMLGHDDINHAELYSREAEQQRMAKDAMTRLTRKMTIKKVPDSKG